MSESTQSPKKDRNAINRETGRINWKDLETHFASGALIIIDSTLDLVDTALAMQNDDQAQVALWLEQKRMAKVNDEQAQAWYTSQPSFWAVVVKPWVLIQPITQTHTDNE